MLYKFFVLCCVARFLCNLFYVMSPFNLIMENSMLAFDYGALARSMGSSRAEDKTIQKVREKQHLVKKGRNRINFN